MCIFLLRLCRNICTCGFAALTSIFAALPQKKTEQRCTLTQLDWINLATYSQFRIYIDLFCIFEMKIFRFLRQSQTVRDHSWFRKVSISRSIIATRNSEKVRWIFYIFTDWQMTLFPGKFSWFFYENFCWKIHFFTWKIITELFAAKCRKFSVEILKKCTGAGMRNISTNLPDLSTIRGG